MRALLLIVLTTISITLAVTEEDSAKCEKGSILVYETKDTVYVVDSERIPVMIQQTRQTFREKGFGIGGGPMPGVYAINMAPVRELTEKLAPFAGKSFHFGPLDYRAFHMKGGAGYVGVGNGLRIGGGGCGGKTEIISSFFSGDSVFALETHVGFGGFLVEKGFSLHKTNMNFGGYIGGGNYEIKVNALDMRNISAFEKNDDIDEEGELKAEFMLLELHGGMTYSIVPFFHLGVDVSMPSFISTSGFSATANTYGSEFFTINPGLQIRVIFGNLG